MSGIFGIYNLDDKPVSAFDLGQMASKLECRGPDRTGLWHKDSVGLGHTLLATTPEALLEHLPLSHSASGCTITADVRLDNRASLLTHLGLVDRAEIIGDAEIVLRSYLKWHSSCVEYLHGDFAFVIHDPRHSSLFCARDHFGVRPFNYHHSTNRFFVFASEPEAILALQKTPYKLNEGRIADFLITQLEGIDKTSTFFDETYRLPPAHTLTITPDRIQVKQYWTLKPGPELHLGTDDEYAEAFLEVFTTAVQSRLRSTSQVGSMLSGGMDSGAVVAIAKELLAGDGKGPLPTFSAIGPDSSTCIETRTTLSAQSMEGIEPHSIRYDQLNELLPELAELTRCQGEPFDNHMTLLRAVYLLARQQGIKIVLDGIDGDSVLSEGAQIARLLRRGRFRAAHREAIGQNLFWKGAYPVWRQLFQSSRDAFVPKVVRTLRDQLTGKRRSRLAFEKNVDTSLINRDFARKINLEQRLQKLGSHRHAGLHGTAGTEAALALDHPYLTTALERYNRVASSLAIEPRHPWLDQRVVAFCLTLPGDQKMWGGWPKIILRRAMLDRLPDTVRWRQGKEHLGWNFTSTLIEKTQSEMKATVSRCQSYMTPYLDARIFQDTLSSPDWPTEGTRNMEKILNFYEAASMASWLENFVENKQ